MRVIRAWPARPPAGHARVTDAFERVPVDDYDYSALTELCDDVLLLDWDVAVSPEDLRLFAKVAANSARPVAAPTRAYPGGLHGTTVRALPRPQWMLYRYQPGGQALRECSPSDATCHLFGFGMCYLPGALIAEHAEHCARLGGAFTDTGFGGWHYATHPAQRDVPVCWDVHPVHCNYPPPVTL